jgi:hypothetical protein
MARVLAGPLGSTPGSGAKFWPLRSLWINVTTAVLTEVDIFFVQQISQRTRGQPQMATLASPVDHSRHRGLAGGVETVVTAEYLRRDFRAQRLRLPLDEALLRFIGSGQQRGFEPFQLDEFCCDWVHRYLLMLFVVARFGARASKNVLMAVSASR